MARTTARDLYIAIVVGGGLVGSVLMALGAVLMSAAYSGATNEVLDLVEGTTFFVVGAPFIIVSLILVPARRQLALEGGQKG
jgi:hypothetical protein